MRIAIVVAAFGLVLGMPGLAPSAMLNTASAQTTSALQSQVDAILGNPALTDAQKSDQLAVLVASSADPVFAAAQVVQAAGNGANATVAGTAVAKAAATVRATNPNIADQVTLVATISGGAVAAAAATTQAPVAGANIVITANTVATPATDIAVPLTSGVSPTLESSPADVFLDALGTTADAPEPSAPPVPPTAPPVPVLPVVPVPPQGQVAANAAADGDVTQPGVVVVTNPNTSSPT